MRKYGKWALTLGLAAAMPAMGLAAPWSADQPADKTSAKATNQKMADEIALALHKARLQGYDIEIEYKDGTAILKGRVTDPRQKEKATQVVEKLPGVSHVENKLVLAPKSTSTLKPNKGQPAPAVASAPVERVQQASASAERPDSRVQPVNFTPASDNQQMAEQIAAALTAASLDGYDIEIRYQNGTAVLGGSVETMAQRQAAERVVSQVPGVQSVQNQLRTTREPAAPPAPTAGPMMAAAPMMPAPNGMPIHPTAYQQGMPPAGPMPAGIPAAPVGYGHGGPGAAPAVYNMPSVPEHAWPAYAQYPNYAAVTYPSQYSASAWPYIGPFYPYPQVPLGWRDATLRWDDGYWNLQFRQRTDKWWWFVNPHNW